MGSTTSSENNQQTQQLTSEYNQPRKSVNPIQRTSDDDDHFGENTHYNIRKIQEGEPKESPIVSVIVTICGGSSYDQLFTQVKQASKEGRVVVYQITPSFEKFILKKFKEETLHTNLDEESKKLLNELYENILSVDPDAVVFNWECCSEISNNGYKFTDCSVTYELSRLLIDRKSMVMFTHFSIQALVNTWDTQKLGPAPFVGIGTGNGQLVLKFDSKKVLDCPSSQLQRVGELCSNGSCSVNGYTVYSVDRTKVDVHEYKLDVLTFITNEVGTIKFQTMQKNLLWNVDGKPVVPCHTLLTYPSGGVLLASNAHWLDLSNLDVNVERLLQVAQNNYEPEKYEKMRNDIMSKSSFMEQKQEIDKYAKMMVQESAPCKYSKRK